MSLPDPQLSLPILIQGGMGVNVSSWRLARAVASQGQIGVISGTGLDRVVACHLQDGDPEGHLRRVLAHFPIPALAERVLATYFVPGGIGANGTYRSAPMFAAETSSALLALTVVANYAEIALAKEGHDGLVGLNLLEKIQLPTLPSLYGAMLAGVDFIIMGAGIPREVPGHLDQLAQHLPASLRLRVEGGDDQICTFTPRTLTETDLPPLKRPRFLAVISSETLAASLLRRATGRIDGFVVEGPIAGGHNAPPRGNVRNELGEPVYGPRDQPDLARIKALGLPFWMAGGKADPARLREAQAAGAVGVQVGTAFAFCRESGIVPELRRRALAAVVAGQAGVRTDPLASPTGFPFKVLGLQGTLGDESVYANRVRVCNLGYLRSAYLRPDGSLGWRCAAEPVADFIAKGGDAAAIAGRKCICNGLMATAGVPMRTAGGGQELPILTSGDDLDLAKKLSQNGTVDYSAADVIAHILAP